MDILFSSAFLLLVIFLITQFVDSKQSSKLKLLAIFGIFVGIISILYVSFIASSVRQVSALEIKTENSTNQNLKVFAITFGKDANDTINRKVIFGHEIAPNKTSSFSIDKEDLGQFWIVAKNDSNEIKYLKAGDVVEKQFNFKITDNHTIDQVNAQTARELIFALDINKQVLNFAIWSNIILIILLIWSIIKLNKIGK